jgi:hypothetical protein
MNGRRYSVARSTLKIFATKMVKERTTLIWQQPNAEEITMGLGNMCASSYLQERTELGTW